MALGDEGRAERGGRVRERQVREGIGGTRSSLVELLVERGELEYGLEMQHQRGLLALRVPSDGLGVLFTNRVHDLVGSHGHESHDGRSGLRLRAHHSLARNVREQARVRRQSEAAGLEQGRWIDAQFRAQQQGRAVAFQCTGDPLGIGLCASVLDRVRVAAVREAHIVQFIRNHSVRQRASKIEIDF